MGTINTEKLMIQHQVLGGVLIPGLIIPLGIQKALVTRPASRRGLAFRQRSNQRRDQGTASGWGLVVAAIRGSQTPVDD